MILSLQEREVIAHELTALEKSPVNGWDQLYPNLFAALQTIIKAIADRAGVTPPLLIVMFTQPDTLQAKLTLMTDGTARIFIGAQLIRRLLCEGTEDDQLFFSWVIAHEIGHQVDSVFVRYAQLYFVRQLIDHLAIGAFWVGYGAFFWPRLQQFVGVPAMYLCGVGASVIVIKMIATIFFMRSREYAADKISLNLVPNVTIAQVESGLPVMHVSIKKYVETPVIGVSKTIFESYFPAIGGMSWYKKLVLFKFFHKHPSPQRRLAWMRSLRRSS